MAFLLPLLLLLLGHTLVAVATTPEAEVDREIDSLASASSVVDPRLRALGKVVAAVARLSLSSSPDNTTYGDNDLWRGLFSRCVSSSDASVALSCVKKGVFAYLDGALSVAGDFPVTDGIVFTGNGRVVENKYSRAANEDAEEDTGRAADSFEEVTDKLYDKGVDFLSSHDLTLHLPESLFGGAVLRVSPRSLGKDGGALVTVEAPKQDAADARLFFKKHKFFKKKLMMSFMALMMVIKMIKVKLMFLLPAILGVGTAKKLFLKVLLFLFPAFAHLFKFCSYYHGIHASKFHHHHHQIAHHHHHVPVPVPVPVHHPPEHHHHVEHGPPPSYHSSGPGSSYHGSGGPWESSGPGPEEYVNRNDYLSAVVKHNEQELASWGIGNDNYLDERISRSTVASTTKAPPPQQLSKQQQLILQQQHQYQQQLFLQQQQQLQLQQAQKLKLQQQVLTPRPPTTGTTISVMYDAFYSPILQRMDNVFVQLGFNEEACRERLVCSMYKRPQRFSPHSNLISAELSRDPDELSRPSTSNTASARFHRYVQAAREGQDQKDCLGLYPACTVNTEI